MDDYENYSIEERRDEFTFVGKNIYLGGSIPCDATVKSNEELMLQATDNIILKNGFHAGSNFMAKIISCGYGKRNNDNLLSHDIGMNLSEKNMDSTSNTVIPVENIALLYPNPNEGKFLVEFIVDLNEFKYLKILDIMGKEIYKIDQTSFARWIEINISQFPKGIYFLKIQFESRTFINKIILN